MLDPHNRSGAKTSTQRKGLRARGFWLHQAPVPDCPSSQPARGLDRGPDSWPLASALALSLPSSAEIAGLWSTWPRIVL